LLRRDQLREAGELPVEVGIVAVDLRIAVIPTVTSVIVFGIFRQAAFARFARYTGVWRRICSTAVPRFAALLFIRMALALDLGPFCFAPVRSCSHARVVDVFPVATAPGPWTALALRTTRFPDFGRPPARRRLIARIGAM
jgi:hypothetical protein